MELRVLKKLLPSAGFAGAILGGGREECAARRATTAGRGAKPPSGSLGLEVFRGGVVEDERGDRRLGVHHEALGEADADALRLQQPPERHLVGELGARRVPEGDAKAAITRLELVVD